MPHEWATAQVLWSACPSYETRRWLSGWFSCNRPWRSARSLLRRVTSEGQDMGIRKEKNHGHCRCFGANEVLKCSKYHQILVSSKFSNFQTDQTGEGYSDGWSLWSYYWRTIKYHAPTEQCDPGNYCTGLRSFTPYLTGSMLVWDSSGYSTSIHRLEKMGAALHGDLCGLARGTRTHPMPPCCPCVWVN